MMALYAFEYHEQNAHTYLIWLQINTCFLT